MKNIELIEKYRAFYSKIKDLVKDEEVFPQLSYSEFEENLSSWLGIPSFSMTREDMEKKGKPHIAIWDMQNSNVKVKIHFNGLLGVKKFIEILDSQYKRKKFIELIQKFEGAKLKLVYQEKHFAASFDWKDIIDIKCEDLAKQKLDEFEKVILEEKEKRDLREKEIPRYMHAVMGIVIGYKEIDIKNNNEIKEVFTKLANIIKFLHEKN